MADKSESKGKLVTPTTRPAAASAATPKVPERVPEHVTERAPERTPERVPDSVVTDIEVPHVSVEEAARAAGMSLNGRALPVPAQEYLVTEQEKERNQAIQNEYAAREAAQKAAGAR